MARLRYNNKGGTLGSSLTNIATAIDFGTDPGFATIVAPDYIPLVLEPPSGGVPSAKFEIAYLTAFTAAATTGTIKRGQEGTSGVAHSSAVVWACAPTAADLGAIVKARTTAAQTIANPTMTKVANLSTVDVDTLGAFATSRYTPTIPGWYLVVANMIMTTDVSGSNFADVAVFKNGAQISTAESGARAPFTSVYGGQASFSTMVYLDGVTDYVEVWSSTNVGSQSAQYEFSARLL